jgi:hypothetical protein
MLNVKKVRYTVELGRLNFQNEKSAAINKKKKSESQRENKK